MRRTSIIVITIAVIWVKKPRSALKALFSFKGSSVSKTDKQTTTYKRNKQVVNKIVNNRTSSPYKFWLS